MKTKELVLNLFEKDTSFSITQISDKICKSKSTVRKYIKELVNEGLLNEFEKRIENPNAYFMYQRARNIKFYKRNNN